MDDTWALKAILFGNFDNMKCWKVNYINVFLMYGRVQRLYINIVRFVSKLRDSCVFKSGCVT
jgi:hypothetical protein